MAFSKMIKAAGVMLVMALAASGAQAQSLTIGARAEITMDPHHLWLASNVSYYAQIFGTLTDLDETAQARPMLAESWRLVDEKTWEFKINPKAKFHNGQAVTAEDIVASLLRARDLPNAAASFKGAFQGIVEFQAIDPLTLRLLTDRPNGSVAQQMSQIAIIPREIARTASQADFISGRAVIGAGPYRFVRYHAGDRLVLARFDGYAGPRPHWADVTFRFIADDAARVAALIGGDVDLIDYVPPADAARLKADSRTAVQMRSSDRVMYLIPDVSRDRSPFVRDANGEPLARNPMKDVRVRRAIALAMDRDALARSIMDGAAVPANQTVPPGFGGYAEGLQPSRYDLAEARRLLAEAGYPKGFGLTIHCTNDRYVNDARVCQAVGQMLAKLGLEMNVITLPKAVFFPRVMDHAGESASLMLLAWGSSWTGDASGSLSQTLRSLDKAKGVGTWNLGHYANPELDALVDRSNAITDTAARAKVQAEAMTMAMQDMAVIPLLTLTAINASRRTIAFKPYADESTRAAEAVPAK